MAIGRGVGPTGTRGRSATDEPVVRGLIRELARLRPRFGSPRLSALLRRELGPVNHKRVERIYAQEGLQLPRRRKGRRRGVGRAVPWAALTGPNQRWSLWSCPIFCTKLSASFAGQSAVSANGINSLWGRPMGTSF